MPRLMAASTKMCRRMVLRRRLSTTGTTSSTSDVSSIDPTIMANVLQGPSILHTSHFRSCPSLMMLPGLRSLPFWTSWDGTSNRIAYQDPAISFICQYMESHVATIQSEYLVAKELLISDYATGSEHASSLHSGTWDWYSYMMHGILQNEFSTHFPKTCSILQPLLEQGHLLQGIPFGFAFISNLHGNSTIAAHTSPLNFRLRLHLPLIVPTEQGVGIRVGPVTQSWNSGKAMVLDDSYNHEVWNHTNEERVIFLMDLWHPDVTHDEREEIKRMFAHAKERGWIGGNHKHVNDDAAQK